MVDQNRLNARMVAEDIKMKLEKSTMSNYEKCINAFVEAFNIDRTRFQV